MLKCTHSGDRLAPNPSVGCGSFVSELRNTGKRHLRFKLLANSKPSTKFPVSSDVATAQLPQPTPSNAPSVLTSHQTSVPTGPPTSSTTTHYPAKPYHTTLAPPPGQPPPSSTILSLTHFDPPPLPTAPSSAPSGPPTSPMPHTSLTVAIVHHDEVFLNTRAKTAT